MVGSVTILEQRRFDTVPDFVRGDDMAVERFLNEDAWTRLMELIDELGAVDVDELTARMDAIEGTVNAAVATANAASQQAQNAANTATAMGNRVSDLESASASQASSIRTLQAVSDDHTESISSIDSKIGNTYQVLRVADWNVTSQTSVTSNSPLNVNRSIETVTGATHYVIIPRVNNYFILSSAPAFVNNADAASVSLGFINVGSAAHTLDFHFTVIAIKKVN